MIAAANSSVVTEAVRSCMSLLMRSRLKSLTCQRVLMQSSHLMFNRLCIFICGDGASAQLLVVYAPSGVACETRCT